MRNRHASMCDCLVRTCQRLGRSTVISYLGGWSHGLAGRIIAIHCKLLVWVIIFCNNPIACCLWRCMCAWALVGRPATFSLATGVASRWPFLFQKMVRALVCAIPPPRGVVFFVVVSAPKALRPITAIFCAFGVQIVWAMCAHLFGIIE